MLLELKKQRLENLRRDYAQFAEQLSRLEQARRMETRVEEQFRLRAVIEERKASLAELEREIQALETELQAGAGTGDSARVTDKKTILLLSANPWESARLRLDREFREIEQALRLARHRDYFHLEKRQAARISDLRRAMLAIRPHFVHFGGHGNDQPGREGLEFESEDGRDVQFVGGEVLAGLFKLFADHLECVLLNACYSAPQAEAIARHIPFVIGMEAQIEDHLATEFAVVFYEALGAGESRSFAYQLACNALETAGHRGVPPRCYHTPNPDR